jgi:PPP family 3-phenylpropionic acid transporter
MPPRLASLISSPRFRAIACFVALYSAVGASAPYLPVYYQSLGMSFDVIGLLAAVVSLSTLFAAPAWGIAADRLYRTRVVLPAACLVAAAVALFLGLAVEPAAAALLAVLFWLAYSGVGPLLDARSLEIVAEDQHSYSRLRAWGSGGFVVSVVACGLLIQSAGLRALFIVLVGSLVVSAVLALGLPRGAAKVPLPRLTGLEKVLRSRVLLPFLPAVLIVWSANTAVNAFYSIYLTQIGAPASLVGLSWAIGAVVEIPLMLVFPQLARRFGVAPLVLAGGVLMVLRAAAVALVTDPILVSMTFLIHGAGFALLLVGGVTYVARHAPEGAAATAQGVLAGVAIGLPNGIGPGFGGPLAAAFGLNAMFGVAAVSASAGTALLVFALRLASVPPTTVRTAAGTPR